MDIADIIDSDIIDTRGDELVVTITEDGYIGIHRLVRDDQRYAETALTLTPAAAHELGNKLRLAAKKARA